MKSDAQRWEPGEAFCCSWEVKLINKGEAQQYCLQSYKYMLFY